MGSLIWLMYCCRPSAFLEEITTLNEIGVSGGKAAWGLASEIGGIGIGIFTELAFRFELVDGGIAIVFWFENAVEKREFSKAPEKVKSNATKTANSAFLLRFIEQYAQLRLFKPSGNLNELLAG